MAHHARNLPLDFDDALLDVRAEAEAAAPDESEPEVSDDLLETQVPEVSREAVSRLTGNPVLVNNVAAEKGIVDRLQKWPMS